MNHCSKLLRFFTKYMYQCFYRANFASRVKPKMCRALGIAVVGFVGDHFRDKKATEVNTLDRLLSEDLGLLIPFLTIQVIPPESVRSVR